MSVASIRDAVTAGEYARAAELFDGWARSLPLEEASLREVAELLLWIRSTVLCAQSHAQDRIQLLRSEAHLLASYHS